MSDSNFRRRRRVTFLVLFFFVFAAGWIGMSRLNERPELHIKTIQIQGAHYCSLARVTAITKPYLGGNLVSTFLSGRLRQHLLKVFPQAQKISIYPRFPSALRIQITEKTPFLTLENRSDMVVVAQDGTPLQRLLPNQLPSPPPNLGLEIRGISPRWALPRLPARGMTKLVAIAQALAMEPSLEHPVIWVRHLALTTSSNEDDIVILKDGKTPIKMGSFTQFSTKLAAVRLFLSHHHTSEPSQNIGYIDVRVPQRVIVYYGP